MSRTEQDFLGQREIADDIYYGVQTIRGKENFHITGIPMSQEPYFVKALGYVIPPRVLEAPRPARIADLLTVSLLAALVAVQTLGVGQAIVVDARVPAVLVAAGLLALRAPFLVVVVAAAAVAALLRLWGWAA